MSIFGHTSARGQGERDFENYGRYAGHSKEDRDYQDGFDDAKRVADEEQAAREREIALRDREEEAERQRRIAQEEEEYCGQEELEAQDNQ